MNGPRKEARLHVEIQIHALAAWESGIWFSLIDGLSQITRAIEREERRLTISTLERSNPGNFSNGHMHGFQHASNRRRRKVTASESLHCRANPFQDACLKGPTGSEEAT